MRGERGVGLVELLVVMSLMTLAMTMFGLAFAAMLRTSDASRDIGAVTDQARLALNELDRQIRFGYWVKETASLPCDPYTLGGVPGSSCPAITVLTVDTAGARQCWVWALDRKNGRLVTYHAPSSSWASPPALTTVGGRLPGGWHVAAGPEGGAIDEVAIDAASTLGVVASSLVRPLNIKTFSRTPYNLSAYAAISILKQDRSPVSINFTMTVRNPWIGAEYASDCS